MRTGRAGLAVANYSGQASRVAVRLDDHRGALRYRYLDDLQWQGTEGEVPIPPRSAAIALPADAPM